MWPLKEKVKNFSRMNPTCSFRYGYESAVIDSDCETGEDEWAYMCVKKRKKKAREIESECVCLRVCG